MSGEGVGGERCLGEKDSGREAFSPYKLCLITFLFLQELTPMSACAIRWHTEGTEDESDAHQLCLAWQEMRDGKRRREGERRRREGEREKEGRRENKEGRREKREGR